jgi:hypothetical protein
MPQKTDEDRAKAAISRLEPNPAAAVKKDEKEQPAPATTAVAEPPVAPDVPEAPVAVAETVVEDVENVEPTEPVSVESKPKKKPKQSHPKAAKPAKPHPKPKAKVAEKDEPKDGNQYLDLGAGFKLKFKPKTGYAVLYKVVAERGHFEEVAKALEAEKYDVNNPEDANALLSQMLVPLDRLESWCRSNAAWKAHAEDKTSSLKSAARSGDKQAKNILGNEARCGDGSWSGNFAEMISTCIGYYSFLTSKHKKGDKPNKNVQKFAEAGVVFRRFPLHRRKDDKQFVMMFPEKYIDTVKTAILVGRGINEDHEEKATPKKK